MVEIDDDYLDARIRCGVDGRHKTLTVARVDNQRLHALRHHVLDIGDLLVQVVAGIGRNHGAAQLFGMGLGRHFLRREIRRIKRLHRDADLAFGKGGRRQCKNRSCRDGSHQGSFHTCILPNAQIEDSLPRYSVGLLRF